MVYYFQTELAGFTIFIVTLREVEEDGFLSTEIEKFWTLIGDAMAVRGKNVKVLWL